MNLLILIKVKKKYIPACLLSTITKQHHKFIHIQSQGIRRFKVGQSVFDAWRKSTCQKGMCFLLCCKKYPPPSFLVVRVESLYKSTIMLEVHCRQ